MLTLGKGETGEMCKILGEYLAPYIDDIEKYYDWRFKEDVALKELAVDYTGGGSWYQKTIRLKEEVATQMNNADSDKEIQRLVTYFIKEWGGIRMYKRASDDIKNYKNLAGTGMLPDQKFPFNGVASWSKYLSLICPDWACIYDSRVAYSINVINYLSGNYKYFFPLPSGESSKLNLIGIETLFIDKLIPEGLLDQVDSKATRYAANVRDKFHITKNEVYRVYIGLLKATASHFDFNNEEYHKIEMLLFSLAPTEVLSDLIKKLKCESKKPAGVLRD